MIDPLLHQEKIFGSTELEDFVFRARKVVIIHSKNYGFSGPYFDRLTELRSLIDEQRRLRAPAPKVCFIFSYYSFSFTEI